MEEERKQREFHANPCPNFSHPAIPERPTLTATKAAPFQLSYDTRGASKKEKFLSQVQLSLLIANDISWRGFLNFIFRVY